LPGIVSEIVLFFQLRALCNFCKVQWDWMVGRTIVAHCAEGHLGIEETWRSTWSGCTQG